MALREMLINSNINLGYIIAYNIDTAKRSESNSIHHALVIKELCKYVGVENVS